MVLVVLGIILWITWNAAVGIILLVVGVLAAAYGMFGARSRPRV